MFKLTLIKNNLKLYKINICVEAALETILQGVTLAIVMFISKSQCKGTTNN